MGVSADAYEQKGVRSGLSSLPSLWESKLHISKKSKPGSGVKDVWDAVHVLDLSIPQGIQPEDWTTRNKKQAPCAAQQLHKGHATSGEC